MKAFIICCLVAVFAAGCSGAGIKFGLPDKPCTQCDDVQIVPLLPEQDPAVGKSASVMEIPGAVIDPERVSYICSLTAAMAVNPCQIHDMAVMIAKEGYVLKAWQVDEFAAFWNDTIKPRVVSGINFGDLKMMVIGQLAKLNRAAGGTLLVASDFFLQLPDDKVIPTKDQAMIILSGDDLVVQLRKFATWF